MVKLHLLGCAAALAVSLFADTVVLQDGTNGYSGTEDVTVFSNRKSETYSWYTRPSTSLGNPSDEEMVNSNFCC